MPEELIQIAIVGIVFGSIFGPGIIAMWAKHKRELAELEIRKRELELQRPAAIRGGSDVAAQLEALRQELSDLRDTSTRFDMSLDTNLQQMQQRMAFLENQIQELKSQQVRG